MSVHLLVIDPQNDFMDLPDGFRPACGGHPEDRCTPALPVAGAHQDMLRLAAWLDVHRSAVSEVTVTLDHHHRLDIAHPTFWRTGTGDVVAPLTPISLAQMDRSEFLPAPGLDPDRIRAYLAALESAGRFSHMVWPIHCQIGTWGACVHSVLQGALDRWEDGAAGTVKHIRKGENPWTEHYSALSAEIPDPTDSATGMDHALLTRLAASDLVVVAGEAASHCVRATLEHLVGAWDGDPSRIVLLTDAMSAVTGFEESWDIFRQEVAACGVRLATTSGLTL